MTRDQKQDMYFFLLLAIVCTLAIAFLLLLWGQWTYSLVVLHDYVPDPWGLFMEDSQLVGWLLSL